MYRTFAGDSVFPFYFLFIVDVVDSSPMPGFLIKAGRKWAPVSACVRFYILLRMILFLPLIDETTYFYVYLMHSALCQAERY